MFKCECGSPADFFIVPEAGVQGDDRPIMPVTRTATCLEHAKEALQDSGAYQHGKVIRLTAAVHRETNTGE